MSSSSRVELAGLLVSALFPDQGDRMVNHSIREQMLVDALQSIPTPVTLRDLLRVLEADSRSRGSVAIELLAMLRRRALEAPDLALERFVQRSADGAVP